MGSHDSRGLQLYPKMYYYSSPTLRSETTLPLKNSKKTKTKQTKKQTKNVCDSVKTIENRAERLHNSANLLKRLEHRQFKDWYHVKEERLFYLSFTFWKLCYVYFDHTKPSCKLLRQTSKIKELQTTFWMVCLFRGLPLNNYGVECKEYSTM